MKRLLLLLLFCPTIIVGLSSTGRTQVTDEFIQRRWLSKKPVIDSIVIEGNTYLSDGKIKSNLFSRKTNILLAIKSDRRRRVQRETMMKDTSEIKYLYLSNGFLAVKVDETFRPLMPDSNALVTIHINEGRQFFYDRVTLGGDYDAEFKNDLYGITSRLKKGHPVDPFQLRQATYDLKSVLANNGYPYARAEFIIDTSINDNLADIAFHIRADSLVYFGEIGLTGAKNFDPDLVYREITFEPGDIYRRRDLIESQKRLLGTGYYLTLRLESLEGDTLSDYSRLRPDFHLSLREKKPHYVSIQTGAAQDSLKDLIWSFSASWGKRNFLSSRNLELSAKSAFVIFTEWRLKTHSYSFRITEPWFLGLRMPLSLTARLEPGVKAILQDYRVEKWSLTTTTTKNIKEYIKIQTGFQYESVQIYGVSAAAEEQIKEEEGLSIRRKFYVSLLRDSRNNLFVPDKGSVTGLRFEYIGGLLGGDDSFYLLEGNWSRYQRLWPGWISASRLKGGFIQEMGEARAVPTNDRYYIGGANTIRGFSEGSLGPQTEQGNPAGADIILIINQEFRFPLISKFWGSLFCDIGNGYHRRSGIKFDNLAVSYGTGLQFISPAGPIRLDYARRVRVKNIEPDHKFHFTILYAF